MPIPIQEQPESTAGRKPARVGHEEPAGGPGPVTRSGGALRREEADESEAAGEIRDREQDQPEPVIGLDE